MRPERCLANVPLAELPLAELPLAEVPLVSLLELQTRFAAAVIDSEAVTALLPDLRGDPLLAERRLALYRTNLAAHWEKALAAAYPVVRKQLGDRAFLALSTHYGHRFPSRCGDLNRFGTALAEHLQECTALAPYPWLPDLARLEWAVHRAHYCEDAAPLSGALLASFDADALDRLAISLHPACSVLTSAWNIAAAWQWHQGTEQGEWLDDIGRPVTVLVWRSAWKTQVRALERGEAAGLAAISAHADLGCALEEACSADPAIDVAATVERWLRDGLIVECAPPRVPTPSSGSLIPGRPHEHGPAPASAQQRI